MSNTMTLQHVKAIASTKAIAPTRAIAPTNSATNSTAPIADGSTNDIRYQRGLATLEAVDGPGGRAVVAGLAECFPDFSRYLVEFPFGDIYARPGVGLRERELATVAALCALGNALPQLRVHVHAALHVGCRPQEVVEIVMQMAVYAGFPAALNGLGVVREVFENVGIALPLSGGEDPATPFSKDTP